MDAREPLIDPDLAEFMRSEMPLLQLVHESELEEAVTCLAVSSDCMLVAAGSFEEEVVVLDAQLQPVSRLAAHKGGTNALCWASGDTLLTVGEDGTACIWAAQSGQCISRLACEGIDADKTPDGHSVSLVACSTDGKLAAVTAGRTVHLIHVTSSDMEGSRKVFPPVPNSVVECLTFVGGGSSSSAASVAVHQQQQQLQQVRAEQHPAAEAAAGATAPGGHPRLLVSYYGGVTIFSPEPEQPGIKLEYGTAIHSVASTPDLQWCVGGAMDQVVHIWHLRPCPEAAAQAAAAEAQHRAQAGLAPAPQEQEGAMQLVEFSCGGYDSKVISVAFNHEGRMLGSCGGPHNTVWDFGGEGPGGTTPVVCLGHTQPLTCQAWQPAAPGLLATGGKDGRVLVYDVDDCQEQEGMPKLTVPVAAANYGDEVQHVVWSGTRTDLLYSGHASGSLRAWRIPSAVIKDAF